MFRRVLVANRGEIAARILRACREMGIETVAVHSTADEGSPHLTLADRRICLGPPQAARSYLDMDAVLQAAEQTECQAVHPGYGFLAENALFAARCASQSLTFIGPPPRLIRTMGDKVEARRTMRRAGVATIPGSDGLVADVGEAARIADKVGYPVFLKATAGGGGKGMRQCEDERALKRNFPLASGEAASAFGNPALYVEKAIVGGRHIEFQILADAWGNAVHLGERECSVQRHHQKLIEESPSPAMDPATRRAIGASTAAALAGLGYVNAGTVEFLREPSGNLYFMEMNTRLQVEHPVTEEVTGIDIVKEQIRIAANERLSITQDQIQIKGHALEFRLNAEDPDAGFRPSPGTIARFTAPVGAKGVRLETHLNATADGTADPAPYDVPPWYDSLIAKMIVSAPDRAGAIAAAVRALEATRIEGIKTTLPLHLRVLKDPTFLSGAYDVTILSSIMQGV